MTQICAPTVERVRKSADIDIPLIDKKRRRQAFRLVGAVENMWRAGKVRDEQLQAFKRFERDLALTSPSRTLLARVANGSGAGDVETGTEDAMNNRVVAFRNLAEIEKLMEPRVLASLRMLVLNDVSLEDIGRKVLMFSNRPQAKAATEVTIQQGTWWLAVHYGFITHHSKPG